MERNEVLLAGHGRAVKAIVMGVGRAGVDSGGLYGCQVEQDVNGMNKVSGGTLLSF